MRYILAIMAFFAFAFAACRQNVIVECDVDQVVAEYGDTYWSIANAHCTNIQDAVFEIMDLNPYQPGNIQPGDIILLP